ncbi:MAG: rRNA maturation RNase YbeY [Bacteroidota bacterium]
MEETTLHKLVALACTGENFSLEDLSIVLSDHATVRELNVSYLNHDYNTDVLSFPLNDPEVSQTVDGEIYVDLDTAAERCAEFGVTFEEEACRYVVHGLLHLMGYLDDTAEGKATMRSREDLYLAMLRKS